jgi:Zn-finger nucleic acid-binding protein
VEASEVVSVEASQEEEAPPAAGKSEFMKCPKCTDTELVQRNVKGKDLVVDCCPKCRGIWFDSAELEAAMPTAVNELHVPDRAVKLKLPCPRCQERLYMFQYPQTRVAVEMCKKCKGLWLDGGEFKQIHTVRNFLDERGMLKKRDEVPGVKGALLQFIDSAIQNLRQGPD